MESIEKLKELSRLKRKSSLGALSALDDDLMLELFSWLTPSELLRASLVSHLFYLYADEDELWKKKCIARFVSNKVATFSFKSTWKHTVMLPPDKFLESPFKKLVINDFYSKKLYGKWYRGHVPIEQFYKTPSHVDRIPHTMSLQEFIEKYESLNKPCIVTGALADWKASSKWTIDNLLQHHGNTLYKTNGTDEDGHTFKMRFKDYLRYIRGNQDEKPIYLFDNKFLERAPDMRDDWEVPPFFGEDLFNLMTDVDRPDYRWFLVGCPRSGSPFHQDPHRTSAWNALIAGRKRWALYPPHVLPPGVDEELIDTEYYASPEVMKWYTEYYPFIPPEQMPLECVQEPGEIIFVPSGWWHQVLNLSETVAVTQNFCSPRNFKYVFADMKKRDNKSLRRKFKRAIVQDYSELFTDLTESDESSTSSDSSSSSESD